MSGNRLNTIAIIGGGPAGGALGALLAKRGHKVGIFHTDKRPPLIVGESLLPATVPMLRTLGIEEQVKSFSVHKPGATVCLNVNEVISSFFSWADGRLPDYAYNTPRDLFDRAVLGAAEKAGATVFRVAAKLERSPSTPGGVVLTQDTLDAAGGFFAPGAGAGADLIVDASGRTRLISRLLEIPIREGGRQDTALFAHLSKAFLTDPGNIHVDYLTKGWSWRIPLPGRVSLGVVIDPKHLGAYGDTIEEQYDRYLREEPSLKVYTEGATRLTPVVKYNNYQVISQQLYGPGWVMLGDAAGFIDPVFSTGVYLGMKGAFELAGALENYSPASMQAYQDGRHWELSMWQGVIDSWYNGTLFSLYRAGQAYQGHFLGARLSPRVRKRLLRIFTGQAVDDRFNITVFGWLIELGKVLRDPSDLVVV